MNLRRKFGLLALLYVVSLSANFAMSAWCIVVYFDSAFRDFQSGAHYEQQIERIRQTLRQQRDLLESDRSGNELAASFDEYQRDIEDALLQLSAELSRQDTVETGTRLAERLQMQEAAGRRWLALRQAGQGAMPPPAEEERAYLDLDLSLLEAGSRFGLQRQENMAVAARVQEQVMTILMVNTALGTVLCALGVVLVRRWILQPVADLREATRQIAQGRFDYRLRPRTADELGRLATEVNDMAATIQTMQDRLIEQERLAAAGEMVTRLAHNIRNPLAGIRGLSEASIALHPQDQELVGCQQRIIDTVDRFEKWLRDLQQSVSPMKLSPRPADLRELVDGVMTALRPMFDRRGVRCEVSIDPALARVQIDAMHFEQALVALVTNAVQASESGGVVRIIAGPSPERHGHWRLSVQDEGAGIAPELQRKIFLPYFTTKPEGNGLGLAMANKVVRLHGGHLSVESRPGHGSRFHADLPGMAAEEKLDVRT